MRRNRPTYSSDDPFKASMATSVKRIWSKKEPTTGDVLPSTDDDDDLTSPPKLPVLKMRRAVSWSELNPNVSLAPYDDPHSRSVLSDLPPHQLLLAFIIDVLPRQLYLLLLLRLPYLYFSRVYRLFEEAELSIKDIKRGLLDSARQSETGLFQGKQITSEPYERLQKSWNGLVDSLIQEWNTLNIVSVLLLGALLTALQLDGAATDPLTRFSALISMLCALMSLMYGCMFIIRFGTMRKTYKAAVWANEIKSKKIGMLWNVWIMLALPAVWLAWAMILYVVCIMSYVWRSGTDIDSTREPFSAKQARAPRIVVTVVLFLGLTYLLQVIITLGGYGDKMDREWQQRLHSWLEVTYPHQPGRVVHSQPATVGYGRPDTGMYSKPGTGYPQPNTAVYSQPGAAYPKPDAGPYSRPPTGPYSQPPPTEPYSQPPTRPYSQPPTRPYSQPATGPYSQPDDGPYLPPATGDSPPSRGMPMMMPEPFVMTLSGPVRIKFGSDHQYHLDDSDDKTDVGPWGERLATSSSKMAPGKVDSASQLSSQSEKDPGPVKVTKLMSLTDSEGEPVFDTVPTLSEDVLEGFMDNVDDWKQLRNDIRASWPSSPNPFPSDLQPLQTPITQWNKTYFASRGSQIQVCEELTVKRVKYFALYHFDSTSQFSGSDPKRYKGVPEGLERLDVLDCVPLHIHSGDDGEENWVIDSFSLWPEDV